MPTFDYNPHIPRGPGALDATSSRVNPLLANSTRRDQPTTLSTFEVNPVKHASVSGALATQSAVRKQQQQQQPSSSSNSQVTTSTNDTDSVFTPPGSEGRISPGNGSAQGSSQESQLLQLSQIAAAQQRIPEDNVEMGENGAASRKRMADGTAKHTRNGSSASPVRMGGHSRNTSTVSVASTTGSRIGEVSQSLQARLSYLVVKVDNGWQSHSIDQVETMASQAASPASSSSTIHLRTGSSASPQLSNSSHRGSNNTTPATGLSHHFSGHRGDSYWRDGAYSASTQSPTSPAKPAHSLAPPVSIQPSRHLGNARRNSNPRLTPTFLSQGSPMTGPHTPGQPSPYSASAQRTPTVDTMHFSPHTNVREQDAIESLLFMSSPGNSANLKHTFPSSSQPLPSGHNGPQRTALPTSQPRKSLPNGRPLHARSQSQVQKRVGFEKVVSEMEGGDPYLRGAPRRKVNGTGGYSHGDVQYPGTKTKPLSVSAGLVAPSKSRPQIGDADIDRLLADAAAASDSESDGEIVLPSAARRDGARFLGS
ncbi:cell cycle transcriptional repressor whi5 [Echria macrotheca]|uniref:Cell cycle transcriptional repressor whi5 n=1 Tax=Echria macrotheca TaxID=438768 RepID=A0AAJ0F995_9PEZI|nr:cell cycle transcriptional repressor whi5 [Echria macrotheca]